MPRQKRLHGPRAREERRFGARCSRKFSKQLASLSPFSSLPLSLFSSPRRSSLALLCPRSHAILQKRVTEEIGPGRGTVRFERGIFIRGDWFPRVPRLRPFTGFSLVTGDLPPRPCRAGPPFYRSFPFLSYRSLARPRPLSPMIPAADTRTDRARPLPSPLERLGKFAAAGLDPVSISLRPPGLFSTQRSRGSAAEEARRSSFCFGRWKSSEVPSSPSSRRLARPRSETTLRDSPRGGFLGGSRSGGSATERPLVGLTRDINSGSDRVFRK